jgi:hypothetical protein
MYRYCVININIYTCMSNWISLGIGIGTGGIPTTDNIPVLSVFFVIPFTPRYIDVTKCCGYPIRTYTDTQGNSVSHVCIYVLKVNCSSLIDVFFCLVYFWLSIIYLSNYFWSFCVILLFVVYEQKPKRTNR